MAEAALWDDGFDALSRHLPWDCFVGPGVLLLEEAGALMGAIEYQGPDASVLDPETIAQTEAAVANVLQPFGGGWTLHLDLAKRAASAYPRSTGAHPMAELIDGERRGRMHGTGFAVRTVLAITHVPDRPPTRRAFSLLTRHPPERAAPDVLRDHVEPFRSVLDQVAALLGRALTAASVLEGEDLLGFLHACVSPVPQDRVALPSVPGFPVKAALVDTGFVPSSFPAFSNGAGAVWHVRVLSIAGYPAASHPGLLDGLLALPFPYRWSVRFEGMDHLEARGVFAALWRKHDDTAYDWRSVLLRAVGGVEGMRRDPVGVLEALEAEAARVEAEGAGTSSGWMTPTAVVWGASVEEAEDRKEELAKLLRTLGFAVIEEGFGAERAWYGTLPGQVRANPRRVPLTQVQLGDFAVLTKPWSGPVRNAHLGTNPLMRLDAEGGVPLHLDLHEGPDAAALVVGPPRAGKSTLLAFMGHQFLARVPKARVIWLDVDARESTSMVATWAAGGRMLAVGGDLALQPLADVDTADGFTWAHGFLLDLLRLQSVGTDGGNVAREVADALRLLAAGPQAERTLSHFLHLVQSNAARVALAPWCRGGPLGDLMDAGDDAIADSPWTTVDLGDLLARGPLAIPVLRALLRRFFRLFADGRPTLFIVDEAFKALKERPDEIDEIRRRGPKRNVALVLATHLLDDVDGSAVAPVLRTIRTLLLLPDPQALRRGLHRDWGLSAAERRLVATGVPRRDVLFKAADGSRKGQLDLDPVASAVCARGGAADRDRAMALMAKVGPQEFPAAWLRACGLEEETDVLEGRR